MVVGERLFGVKLFGASVGFAREGGYLKRFSSPTRRSSSPS